MGYKCNKRSLGQLSNAASFIDIDFDNNTGIQWHFKPLSLIFEHISFCKESSLVFFLSGFSFSPRFNHLYSFVSIPIFIAAMHAEFFATVYCKICHCFCSHTRQNKRHSTTINCIKITREYRQMLLFYKISRLEKSND